MTFQFDVAFSFLSEDASLAFEINKHLSNYIKSFIYVDKQEFLTGKDGPAKFTNIFRKESRLVVILYRKQYGNTNYTSVEKNAIAARALETNWNFVILIPLEKPIPEWYPYTYIYVDPKERRPDQIASIIEFKLRELGGEIRSETLEDKALKVKKENDFRLEKERFLASPEALLHAKKLFDQFHILLKERTKKLGELVGIKFNNNHLRFNNYRQTYQFIKDNISAKDSYLTMVTEKVSFNDMSNKTIYKEEIRFDINESRVLGWSYDKSIIDSEILYDKLVTKLIELK